MDVPILAAPVSSSKNNNSNNGANRRSANYHPSVWKNYFLAYDSKITRVDRRDEHEHEQLKEEVKKMLDLAPENSFQKMNLIDKIQRLGVAYHFEKEIEASLNNIYDAYQECINEDGDDINTVALRFRLLRQQGHHVSCEVFNKFKDPNGGFNEYLVNSVKGILSLYEAAHYRVHGEDILEEALSFTTHHLESILPTLSPSLAAQTNQALKLPLHKSLTRLAAKEYILIYGKNAAHNDLLLKFAKIDFNILQKMHQRELNGITVWWKSLELEKNFPFARDRLVECYFWILGVYFEPQYCLARRFLTKVISMTSIIDDIYDVYGTIDELQLFTNAIDRWDATTTNELPSYMQSCYRALYDVYDEIEKELTKKDRLHLVGFAKDEMKNIVKAYFAEAKWFHNKYTPSFEEYMEVALVTSAYTMLATNSYLGMGDIATEEAFEWVTSKPLMVKAASVICRLSDDIVGHEFEQERGHVASAVECFMHQYGVSKEAAYVEFHKQIANAWKIINAECLRPTAVPIPLLLRILNLARVINLIYKDEDGYTHSRTKLKNFVTSVLVEPVI